MQLAIELQNADGMESAEPRLDAPGVERRSCNDCLARKLSLCAGFGVDPQMAATKNFKRIPARRIIQHARATNGAATFICDGWAAASIALTDGGRQITAILLPGDLASLGDVVETEHSRTIEAVTDVVYRTVPSAAFRDVLAKNPPLVLTLIKEFAREREYADQLALDLGRRTSDQRIARLLLELHARLTEDEDDNESLIAFPLRQHQIADATGLTPVHVCKVLKSLSESGYIEISDRAMRIRDLEALRNIAA